MLKTFVLLQCYLSQNLTLVSLSRMLHRIVDQLLCLKKNPLKYEIKKNHEIFATLKTMITQNIFHWIILFLGCDGVQTFDGNPPVDWKGCHQRNRHWDQKKNRSGHGHI